MTEQKPIIEIRKISKTYKVFQTKEHYLALRDVLTGLVRMPFNILSGKNRRTHTQQPFTALNEVSFSVNRGEIMGVIGPNGAGKSTLLKVLNRITEPSGGEVVVRGTISALLEVGTGFHPELTGRENVYFSGAILGMKRKEIDAKFDRIVKFAEVEEFLDMPVKRYSSGMQVRLAFSVAIHMEPDILLIDEVLAVGDAAFQKKCLEKIHEAARKDNRTILFVSHNLEVVQSLCDRCVYLNRGKVEMIGDTAEVVQKYLEHRSASAGQASVALPVDPEKKYEVLSATVLNADNIPDTTLELGQPFFVDVEYTVRAPKEIFWIQLQCLNEFGTLLFTSRDTDRQPALLAGRKPGTYRTRFTFPSHESLAANSGRYLLSIKIPQDPTNEVTLAVDFTDPRKKFLQYPGALLLVEPWAETRVEDK